MRFENQELKTTFDLPDRLTPRQVAQFDSEVDFNFDKTLYERLWPAACRLVENFQSEYLPGGARADYLDGEEFDPRTWEVVKWVSLTAFSYVRKFKAVPKN